MSHEGLWLGVVALAFLGPRLGLPPAWWPLAGGLVALWGGRIGWKVKRKWWAAVGGALGLLMLWYWGIPG